MTDDIPSDSTRGWSSFYHEIPEISACPEPIQTESWSCAPLHLDDVCLENEVTSGPWWLMIATELMMVDYGD